MNQYWAGLLDILHARVSNINDFIRHSSVKGSENEQVISNFIASFLPKKYAITSGQLIDHVGNQSSQCDLIIFDQIEHSNVLLNERLKIIPLDICYATIEVKTTYRRKDLKEGLKNIAKTRQTLKPLEKKFIHTKFNPQTDLQETHPYTPSMPVSVLFFLTNGISSNPMTVKKQILDEYRSIVKINNNNWNALPDLLFSLKHGLAVRFKDIDNHSEDNLEFILFALEMRDSEGNIVLDNNRDSMSIELSEGMATQFLIDFGENHGIFRTDVVRDHALSGNAILFSDRNQKNCKSKKLQDPKFYEIVRMESGKTRIIDEARALIAFLGSLEKLLDLKKIIPYPISEYYFVKNYGKGELI